MSVKSSSATQYGTPNRSPKARAAAGRCCEAPGCGTILSTYNAATTCYLHTMATTRRPLERNR